MRMNIGPDDYNHLNDDSMWHPKFHQLSIPEIVKAVDSANYGTHRFLSELLRVRKAKLQKMHDEGFTRERDELMEGIEKLLNEGCF